MKKSIPIRNSLMSGAVSGLSCNYTDKILSEGGTSTDRNGNSDTVEDYVRIPLDSLVPRSINQYSQTRIQRLAESIRNTDNLLINPIIVCKIEDLPENGDVMKKFRENGTDLSSYKYVIVAGERRFRAFNMLRDEEEKKEHEPGYINPFFGISARILTSEQAKNEQIYYEDSNTESRQLGPEEIMRLFNTALKKVEAPEAKREMLIEMKKEGAFSKEIPEDPKAAAKLFDTGTYCVYYLSNELGIEGWNENTARKYITVINKCCDEVLEAIYDTTFPIREAKQITKFSPDEQRKILSYWKQGNMEEYRKMLEPKKEEKEIKTIRPTSKTAKKEFSKLVKEMKKHIETVNELQKSMSRYDRDTVSGVSDKCSDFIETLEKLLNEM